MNCEQKWIGAELSAANAGDLLQVSQAAFNVGKYGAATALAILSSEESAKASGLALHALAPKAKFRPLKNYFKSHKEKHGAGAAFLIGTRAAMIMDKFFQEINEDKTIPESLKGEVAMQRLVSAAKAAAESDEKPKIFKELDEVDMWHNSADADKQAGFYVANVEGRWHSPATLTRETAARYIGMAKEMHLKVEVLCSRDLRAGLHEHMKKYPPSVRG